LSTLFKLSLPAMLVLVFAGCVTLEKDPFMDPTAPGYQAPEITSVTVENLEEDTLLQTDTLHVEVEGAQHDFQVFSFALDDDKQFSPWFSEGSFSELLDDGEHTLFLRTRFSADSGGNTIQKDTIEFRVQAIDSATLYTIPRKKTIDSGSNISLKVHIKTLAAASIFSFAVPALSIDSINSKESVQVLFDEQSSKITLFSTMALNSDSTNSYLATIFGEIKSDKDSVSISLDSATATIVAPSGNASEMQEISITQTRGTLVVRQENK